MGHREDLLAGAKKCLQERGYAHTTARDIVTASGTNLASIGYHFGSKDALMTQAMMEMMGEWGDRFSPPELRTVVMSSAERFESTWDRLIALFGQDRNLLVASIEIFAQIERTPELRKVVAQAYEEIRLDMARDFLTFDEPADPAMMRATSSVLLAMLSGIITQYLVDPEHAPTAKEIVAAMRFIGKALG